jgi:hypothetical protein
MPRSHTIDINVLITGRLIRSLLSGTLPCAQVGHHIRLLQMLLCKKLPKILLYDFPELEILIIEDAVYVLDEGL